MGTFVVWNGTPDEGRALVDAIAHNCTCEFGIMGVRTNTCGAHKAFTTDQRFCDWLVFYRRYWQTHKGKKDAA